MYHTTHHAESHLTEHVAVMKVAMVVKVGRLAMSLEPPAHLVMKPGRLAMRRGLEDKAVMLVAYPWTLAPVKPREP